MTNDDRDKSQEEINREISNNMTTLALRVDKLEHRLDKLYTAFETLAHGHNDIVTRIIQLERANKIPDTDPGIIGRNEWRRDKRIAELEKTIEDAQLELRDLRGENE